MNRSEPPSSSVINFKTSMTHVTVEDSKAGLGQTLCTGSPLVGGLSFCNVSELCTSSLAQQLPQGQRLDSAEWMDSCLSMLSLYTRGVIARSRGHRFHGPGEPMSKASWSQTVLVSRAHHRDKGSSEDVRKQLRTSVLDAGKLIEGKKYQDEADRYSSQRVGCQD